MNKNVRVLAALVLSGLATVAYAATDWSTQDYDLYPGDFDGDGKTDLLYVAKDPAKASGIAKSDGSGPNVPFQSWPSNYLGIPWSGNQYAAHVADFDGDSRADIFLQRNTPGDSFLLTADVNGKITSTYQTIPHSYLGLYWSADQHKIAAGDFSGDGKADLFLQATSATGVNAVVLADSNGQFTTGPQQSWTDSSWSAFKWSTKNSNIFVGDFNGDGESDLLIQAKPNIVMIDYEIPIPVPTFPPNSFGVVLSQGGSAPMQQVGVQQWSRNSHGVDWSPTATNIIVGNFDGNPGSDVLLQARSSSRPSYLLTGNTSGAVFSSATSVSVNVQISGDNARLIAGNFDGGSAVGVYVQTITPSGTNYVANVVSTSISANAHNPAAPTGVVPATAVGRTSGSFGVSNDGTATYRIPIEVPPGVRGIQPNLSLVYSSNAGNGLVGMGWSIAGLSEISRCGKTVAQNGNSDGVKLMTADDLCLGGNKLRLTGGNYGYSGSTYRTELEQFSRITAYGTSGNPVEYFIVDGKDALHYEYGQTSDSRIEVSGTNAPRTWALSKVRDRSGNAMTITYGEDNGSFRPNEILYTTNSNPVVTATHKVVFVWELRPSVDVLTSYFAGGLVKELYRLNRIETRYNGALLKRYQLSYGTSSTTQRSRLASVQECDRDGYCLSPTMISWQDSQIGFGTAKDGPDLGASAASTLPIDINGDGRTDLVYPSSDTSTWWFMLANASGGWDVAQDTSISGGSGIPLPIDYNADGKMDLLVRGSGGAWSVMQSTGSGFTLTTPAPGGTTIAYSSPPSGRDFVADFNGDGLQDLISIRSASIGIGEAPIQIFVRLNSPTGFVASSTFVYQLPGAAENLIAFQTEGYQPVATNYRSTIRNMDVNADGKTDLLLPLAHSSCSADPGGGHQCGVTGHTAILLLSTGTAYVDANVSYWMGSADIFAFGSAFDTWRILDANGDGITDTAYSCSNQQNWCVRFGTGVGLSAEVATTIPWSTTNRVIAADWNSDGKTDLLQASGSGNWLLARATGDLTTPFASLIDTNISANGADAAMLSDLNGDGALDLVYANSSNGYRLSNSIPTDRISAITDGFGNNVAVTYAPLTDAVVHTKGSGALFPDVDYQGARYVVRQSRASDGLGSEFTQTYSYQGARINLQGRGFLGFASKIMTDGRTSISRREDYRQDFPYIGMTQYSRLSQVGNVILREVENTLADLQSGNVLAHTDTHFPYVLTSVVNQHEVGGTLNGTPITRQTTSVTLDAYGNPTSTTVSILDRDAASPHYDQTFTRSVVTQISNNATYWCLGQPHRIEETEGLVSTSRVTTTARIIDYEKCRLTQEIVEPDAPAIDATKVIADYSYALNGCGNPTMVTVTGQNPNGSSMAGRATVIAYGSTPETRCRFPTSITNPAGEMTELDHYYDLGLPRSQTDANGLNVNWGYDGFGRKTREDYPDGTASTWMLGACNLSNNFCGVVGFRWQLQQTQLDTNGGEITQQRSYFDSFDRVRQTQVQRALSPTSYAWTYVSRTYDNLGRISTESLPYSGASNGYHRYGYDLVNRQIKDELMTPTNTVDRETKIEYRGRKILLTDPRNNTTEKIYDVLGNLRRVIDPASSAMTQYAYSYSTEGLLLTTVTDAAGNNTVVKTNRLGYKRAANDPDMGEWGYEYNSLGELLKQVDAKGQQVTFEYDSLSRMVSRTELEGRTEWDWGTSATAKNIGQLEYVTIVGMGYTESYVYDTKGRPQTITYNYGADGSYEYAYTYNTAGMLDTLTYPTSTGTYKLRTKNIYAYGQLTQVKDDQSGASFWTVNNTNDYGTPTDESLGNGLRTLTEIDELTRLISSRQSGTGSSTTNIQNLSYLWDLNGNLERRTDHRQSGIYETFTYDALNRLQASTVIGNPTVSFEYTAIGNIKKKTDVSASDYNYASAQPGCSYHAHTQPHAVRKAGSAIYCYDQNGNMTKRDGNTITWTSFNMPSVINSGSLSSTFTYTPDRNRRKQVAVYSDHTETTIYAGLMEKLSTASGTYFRHYIAAGSSTVIHTRWGTDSNQTYYVTGDHLGSSNVITDASGSLLITKNFDAFGQRRGQSWSAPTTPEMQAIAGITRDGYTGHEHLDNLGLIHMNGRVQDPLLGRFISADPFVQAPDASQSLNRYSYTWNNPLNATDPSGFDCSAEEYGCYGFLSYIPFPSAYGGVYIPCNVVSGDFCNAFMNPGAYPSAPPPLIPISSVWALANSAISRDKEGNFRFDPPTLPNWLVDGGVGIGNAVSFGIGGYTSNLVTPDGFDPESDAYRYGGYLAMAAGVYGAVRGGVGYAGSKIVGAAQRTQTLGHAPISKMIAYIHALDFRVHRVTLNLGYAKLMQGIATMRLKYGPRPDVGVLYKSGYVKAIEVASKSDDYAKLIARNRLKQLREGLDGETIISEWAVRIERWLGE